MKFIIGSIVGTFIGVGAAMIGSAFNNHRISYGIALVACGICIDRVLQDFGKE